MKVLIGKLERMGNQEKNFKIAFFLFRFQPWQQNLKTEEKVVVVVFSKKSLTGKIED